MDSILSFLLCLDSGIKLMSPALLSQELLPAVSSHGPSKMFLLKMVLSEAQASSLSLPCA